MVRVVLRESLISIPHFFLTSFSFISADILRSPCHEVNHNIYSSQDRNEVANLSSDLPYFFQFECFFIVHAQTYAIFMPMEIAQKYYLKIEEGACSPLMLQICSITFQLSLSKSHQERQDPLLYENQRILSSELLKFLPLTHRLSFLAFQ